MEEENIRSEEKAKKRIEGWTKFQNFIIDKGIWAGLSRKAKALYPVLLSHAHYITRVGCLSVDTIKRETGLSKGDIPEARKELVDKGLIKIWRKGYLNFFQILDKDMYRQNTDTYPLEEVSIRKIRTHIPRNKANGRFASPQNTDNESPQDPDTYPYPQNTDTKENIEYYKENRLEGSASACLKSQASPSLDQIQNIKTGLVMEDPKQTRALLKNKNFNESMEVLCGRGSTRREAYNTILELRATEEMH